MRGAALQRRFREHVRDHGFQPLQAVGAQQTYPFRTTLLQVGQHLAPTSGAFRRLVVDADDFTGLVLPYRQDHIECLRVNAALAVDLDMHAVDEHDRIVCLQRPRQPLRHIFAKIVQHPGDAHLAVVLPIDVLEHLAHLLLGQTAAVECPRQPLALVLLAAKHRQYRGMEVPVAVAWYPERQCATMAVCATWTVTVPLVAGRRGQKLPALCYHHGLQHELQQVLNPVFFFQMFGS